MNPTIGIEMAVLKSPRNNRKKKQWAESYAVKVHKSLPWVDERVKSLPRVKHSLQLFLRDSSHYVVNTTSSERPPVWFPEDYINERPQTFIRYGMNVFNAASTHPRPFRQHFSSKDTRRRFVYLLNIDKIHLLSSKSHKVDRSHQGLLPGVAGEPTDVN